MKLSSWIFAARLNTLPLSLSSIMMGTFLSIRDHFFSWKIFIFSLLTATLYQILANFSNDLGDGIKGTDQYRIGPKRALQSKLLSKKELKMGIIITSIISLISTFSLLYISLLSQPWEYFLIFTALGIISILSAIFYTLGHNSYGYLGLGDIFVFILFGWIGSAGSYFLYSKIWNWWVLLPASAMGFFATAVLNLNNLRDIENDKKSKKYTIVVKIGLKYGKIYQVILLNLPFFLVLIYILNICIPYKYENFIFMILLLILAPIRRQILHINDPEKFNIYLKKVIFITFIFVLLFGIGIIA